MAGYKRISPLSAVSFFYLSGNEAVKNGEFDVCANIQNTRSMKSLLIEQEGENSASGAKDIICMTSYRMSTCLSKVRYW